jgi:precorrin-2/cobalt-factor-2 C20-methyltransferase
MSQEIEKGIVYCVGVGPGDPELITLKALRIINESDVVIIPVSEKTDKSIAQDIVLRYREKDKTFMYSFSMSDEQEHRQKKYAALALEIKKYLKQDNTVSYVTIGDPTIYSTANYLNNVLKEHGITVKIIPAVSSFNAASSALNVSLCQKGENFGLYELPETSQEIVNIIGKHNSVVFMKINKRLHALKKALKFINPAEAYLIKRAGLEGEERYNLLENNPIPSQAPLSVAVVRK